jgi:hypothetical protein
LTAVVLKKKNSAYTGFTSSRLPASTGHHRWITNSDLGIA